MTQPAVESATAAWVAPPCQGSSVRADPVRAAAPPSAGSPARLAILLPGLPIGFVVAGAAIQLREASGLAALNPGVVALLGGIALRVALAVLALGLWMRRGGRSGELRAPLLGSPSGSWR